MERKQIEPVFARLVLVFMETSMAQVVEFYIDRGDVPTTLLGRE